MKTGACSSKSTWGRTIHSILMDSGGRLAVELAGAQRGREVEVGLKTAIDLNGGVTSADDLFTFAPDCESGNLLAEDDIEAFDDPVIETYQTQSTAIWMEIRGQIMQAGQGLEILWRKAPILHLGSNQHPVRNWLSCNARQDRPPIVQGELRQGYNRDGK